MKKILIIILNFLLLNTISFSQQEQMEIEGAIQIANSSDPTPDEGTIRYNAATHDFEGWNGFFWASLTGKSYETDIVEDVDGNVYKTIKIGNQEWMAENLRTAHYNIAPGNPGDTLLHLQGSTQDSLLWGLVEQGAFCSYNNDPAFDDPYGKIYNWYAVADNNLCPTDWRVPTEADFNTLVTELGGVSVTGGNMKVVGTDHWVAPNAGATNISGFSAFPSGVRKNTGDFQSGFGNYSYLWSLTQAGANSSDSWRHYIAYDTGIFYSSTLDRNYGFGVRCIKN